MGIVLWEIMTFGCMPYPGRTNAQVFEDVVAGYRLLQPPGCPDVLYELMSGCWNLDNRLSFAELEEVCLSPKV